MSDPTSILWLNGQQSVLSFPLNAYISAHRLVWLSLLIQDVSLKTGCQLMQKITIRSQRISVSGMLSHKWSMYIMSPGETLSLKDYHEVVED